VEQQHPLDEAITVIAGARSSDPTSTERSARDPVTLHVVGCVPRSACGFCGGRQAGE
jgi:hypothetical protein